MKNEVREIFEHGGYDNPANFIFGKTKSALLAKRKVQ